METIIQSGNVTYQKILSQVHANIYNLINNRQNVRDPRSRSKNRKFVYQRQPQERSRTFNGFPMVIINSPSIFSPGDQDRSLDRSRKKLGWTIPIKIITSDMVTNRKGKGLIDSDAIAEDIINTLDNETNFLTLFDYGMTDYDYEVTEPEPSFEYNREAYVRFVNLRITGWRLTR